MMTIINTTQLVKWIEKRNSSHHRSVSQWWCTAIRKMKILMKNTSNQVRFMD